MVTLLFLLSLVSLFAGFGVSVYQSMNATSNAREADRDFSGTKIKPLATFAGVAAFALFFSLYLGAYSVDAGSIGVVKRFGAVHGMLQPGLHFVRPIGDTVTEIAVQRRIVKVSEPAATSDIQAVNAEITVAYHIDPNYADFALQQLNNDAEQRVIFPVGLEVIKAEIAQYEAQSLIKRREEVRAGIYSRLISKLAVQHVILEDMSITNLTFSGAYEQAIEQKQVAEQNAEKQRNLLEQTKIEAEQAAAKAKGEADARKAQAEGEATAILVQAQAKAKAQELQRQSLTPELLELRRIEMWEKNWKGDVPQYVVGGSSGFNMLMPAPARKGE